MTTFARRIAVFRYGVIADMVHAAADHAGHRRQAARQGQLRATPSRDRDPTQRSHAETIRGWIRLYRYGGIDALYPKPSTDRGQPRCLANEVAERFVALKVEQSGMRRCAPSSRLPARAARITWLHLGVLIGTIERHECRNDDQRLVLKKFPIPGPESTLPERAALASRAQGLY